MIGLFAVITAVVVLVIYAITILRKLAELRRKLRAGYSPWDAQAPDGAATVYALGFNDSQARSRANRPFLHIWAIHFRDARTGRVEGFDSLCRHEDDTGELSVIGPRYALALNGFDRALTRAAARRHKLTPCAACFYFSVVVEI